MAQNLYTPYFVEGSKERKVDVQLKDVINISSISTLSDWQDYSFNWFSFLRNKGTTGIYTLPESHYNNIIQLASQLALIKKNSNLNYIITSGYRFKDSGSDHSRGAAADLFISSHNDRKQLFDHIYNGPYTWRQLIWEDQKKNSNISSRGNYPDYPGIIHFSYKAGENRKETLYSSNMGEDGTVSSYKPGTNVNPAPEEISNTNNQQITEGNELNSGNISQLEQGNNLVGTYAKTLEQADSNIKNLELGEVDETWGQGYNLGTIDDSKRNNWISLKQYLLYLCTRFTPQSVYPFIELIPAATLSSQDWERDGKSIINENNLKTQNTTLKTNNSVGQTASSNARLKADLWSLDPFQESYSELDVLSDSGQSVYNRRLTGVRIYSQLVLMPESDDISPSKPGGIGFTELTVNAGAQCDNGIAMITMKLVDIQGNKFTDLNSPWSFIYDARPGGVGGDFYFRYGWQLRLPDPKDKENLTSNKFWNHQGWLLFDDGIRQFIASQITPSKPYVTLTQSINELPSSVDAEKYSLFDEGVELLSSDNSITVARTNLQPMNYVKLAILNPEIEVEPEGVITATLNFRTVGALAATIPLLYAENTRYGVTNFYKGSMSLGDFIILLQTDFAQFEYKALEDSDLKTVQAEFINSYLSKLADKKRGRDFSNFVTIIGLEDGGSIGNTHPDDIYISIDDESMKTLYDKSKYNSLQLIGWAREVLNSNGMELNSVATGSGAGINSSWVITVGAEFDRNRYEPQIREKNTETSNYTDALQLMKEEKDVFAFKFQGSLVENIKIEKTEASNALKISTDYAVADFLPEMTATRTDLTTTDKQVTIADRRRNLNILYSQLQNVTITAICHPWIGPGSGFYLKGMGFWDGQYRVLKVVHKLSNLTHFTSEISGARMIVPSDKEQEADVITLAAENGQTERTQLVTQVYSTTSSTTPLKDFPSQTGIESETSTTIIQETVQVKQGNEDKWKKANDIFYHNYGTGKKIEETIAKKIAQNLYNNRKQNNVILSIYSKIPTITSMSYVCDVFFGLHPELKKGYLTTNKEAVNILPELFDKNILKDIKQIIYNMPDEILEL